MKYKKSKRQDLGDNPFLPHIQIPVCDVANVKMYANEDGIKVPPYYQMEQTPFTKVFHYKGFKEIVCELSPAGKCMLLWVIFSLESGKDFICINRVDYMAKNGIKSPKTFAEGCNDLVTHGIFAKTAKRDVYWVNSMILFNGNRLHSFKGKTIEYTSILIK